MSLLVIDGTPHCQLFLDQVSLGLLHPPDKLCITLDSIVMSLVSFFTSLLLVIVVKQVLLCIQGIVLMHVLVLPMFQQPQISHVLVIAGLLGVSLSPVCSLVRDHLYLLADLSHLCKCLVIQYPWASAL